MKLIEYWIGDENKILDGIIWEKTREKDQFCLDLFMTDISKEVRKMKGAMFKNAKGVVTKVSVEAKNSF